jgi:hypothetical protein
MGDAGSAGPSANSWLCLVGNGETSVSSMPSYFFCFNSLLYFSMGATADLNSVAKFTGELYCYNGQCGVCMRTDSENPGLSAPCPMPGVEDKVHIGMSSGNPMNCKAYFYQETPCLKGPPGFKH